MTKNIVLTLTVFLNTIFSFGQIKVQDLKIDTKITGFQFATDLDGMYVYLPNGKQDLKSDKNTSSFSLRTEPNMTYEKSIGYIEYQINYSKRQGFIQSNVIKKDTIISGYKVYEVTFTETLKDSKYKNLVYYSFMLKGPTAIIFLSGDIDNGKYIDKFKKTFRTVKI